MQKGLAPILIVILIAVLVGGYFIYTNYSNNRTKSIPQIQPAASQTPQPSITAKTPRPSPDIKLDESGKFKIYTNHIENYTFKFPADWILEESFGEKGSGDPRIDDPQYLYATIYPPSEKTKQYPQFRNTISVTVKKPNPRRQTQEDKENTANFTKTYNQPVSDGTGQRNYKISNTIVSNQPAVRLIERTLPGDETETFYKLSTWFRYGIYDYLIDFQPNEDFINKNLQVYNLLVDSFKLIGPSPTIKPITLKTYKNEALDYSFQYPSNWLINGFQGGYSKGITVVDENDRELLSLYQEPRYGAPCQQLKDPIQVQFGENTVTLTFDCDHPRVLTANNQEFRMDFCSSCYKDDQRYNALVRSILGLKITQ